MPEEAYRGEDYYYLYNAHGDVVMLLDAATGAVAGTYRYDAFGNVILETGTADNSITYAGYQYDEETGLYYLNARYYDSATARFLTEDTYRGSYQDPLSLNRYTYCHNNPVAYTDPSGHFIIGVLISAGVGALFGAGAELINQKFVQKKDKIDWKAVGYEAAIGAVSGAFGGAAGGVAKSAGKAVVKTTVKSVAKKAVTTGAMEAVEGFASDVGRQVIVDGKSLSEVDYEQALKTGAVAGVAGVGGYAVGVAGDAVKSVTKKSGGTLTEIATKNLDDVVDDSVVKGIVKSEIPSGYYQDATGRWHRPNGQFASNAEVGITSSTKVSTGSHGNSLSDPRTNYGYVLVNRDTNEILKFGETLNPLKRYSPNYLFNNNARMIILEQGSKANIHYWQIDMNNYYRYKYGVYPPLNVGGN